MVIGQDRQFKYGEEGNYSQQIIREEEKHHHNLGSIGRELQDMDASRTLMNKLDEIQSRGRTLPPIFVPNAQSQRLGNVPANKQAKILTQSTFYDGNTSKLLRMTDLSALDLPNPMDLKGYISQHGKPQQVVDESFQMLKERVIQADRNERRQSQLVKTSRNINNQTMQESYKQYNQTEAAQEYIMPQVIEFEDMHYIERKRQETERSKNMLLLNQIIQEVYQKTEAQSQPVRVAPGIVKLDAEKLIEGHVLLKKLSIVAVKEMLLYCLLLRVKQGHTIYKEGESANETSYFILFGKFLMHTSKLGPIGTANSGDSMGEEGLLDKISETMVKREEMATAEEESYVMEFTKGAMDKLKERLFVLHLQMDWFTIVNNLKRQWIQKKSWRQYRVQELSMRKQFDIL
ncbi:hypothetical protein FGO68_gene1252 [Halteria grandinella]|uniref:Cyclic nucleotide-binding domain-containing protein n=1 Tax=Halteria grandinella TaxID=5974 RepID=A0A8J8T4B8_HALGN|nr:hypothetical protein FGO68_gene1252 [Halteria grandinella]